MSATQVRPNRSGTSTVFGRDKAYLAAPIFTPQQLAVVEGIKTLLEQRGFEVFSPYHASRKIWNGRKPADCTAAERRRVLEGNIENLHWCKLLLCWVGGTDNGKTDTGVTWEMGYAHALARTGHGRIHAGTPITLAYIDPSDERQDMNLMLAGTVDAVAHGSELADALQLWRAASPGDMCRVYNPNHLPHESQEMIP